MSIAYGFSMVFYSVLFPFANLVVNLYMLHKYPYSSCPNLLNFRVFKVP